MVYTEAATGTHRKFVEPEKKIAGQGSTSQVFVCSRKGGTCGCRCRLRYDGALDDLKPGGWWKPVAVSKLMFQGSSEHGCDQKAGAPDDPAEATRKHPLYRAGFNRLQVCIAMMN